MTNDILIILWIVICILILLLSLINFFTLQQLQTQINKQIPPSGKSVTKILLDNWDIIGTILVLIVYITTLIFKNHIYFGHNLLLILATIFSIVLITSMIVLRRVVLKNKFK